MLFHIKRLCEHKGEYIGMLEARKHAAWYTKSLRGAAAYRRELSALKSFEAESNLRADVKEQKELI